MRNGISGASVPLDLIYAGDINTATLKVSFFPLVAYAIALVETIEGELAGEWEAATVISSDGGHGLCQPTPATWWTPEMNFDWRAIDWRKPCANAEFSIKWFMVPAEQFWAVHYGMQGDSLIRCLCAEYNAGRTCAIEGHNDGDVGRYTTHERGVSYSDHVLKNYHALINQVNARVG